MDSITQKTSSETGPAPSLLRYPTIPTWGIVSLSASAYLQEPSLNTTSFPLFSAICRRPPYIPDGLDISYNSDDLSSTPLSKSALRTRYQSLHSYLHRHITIPQPEHHKSRPSGHFSDTCTQRRSGLPLSSYLTTLYTRSSLCATIPRESTHAATSAGLHRGGAETTP